MLGTHGSHGSHGSQPAATATAVVVRRWAARLDSPIASGLAALALAGLFVGARLVFGTSGDITRFIVIGSANLSGHGLPHGIHVFSGTGYDGQFYYRQALDPFGTAAVEHGIRTGGYWLQRLMYPLLSWIVSFGQTRLVPYSLVAVNVVAVFVVGLLGGLLARDSGRHALFGLLLAGYFGLVTSLARDLTEIVEVSFLLAGVLAYRRRLFWLSALAFSGAVLTRETEVFVVAAYGVVLTYELGRRLLWRPGTEAAGGEAVGAEPPAWNFGANLVWAVPAVAFGSVQLWLYEVTGRNAAASGARQNFAAPLTAALHAFTKYAGHPFHLANAIWLGELAVLVVVVIAAIMSFGRTSARMEERVALVFLIGLALSLAQGPWEGQVDFRALAPVFELAGIVLLGSRRRIGLVCAILAIAFLVTYVHRVRFI